MQQDPNELLVAARGDIYIAPVGTALPTGPTTVPAQIWRLLGYVTEDGVTFNRSIDIEEFMAWQSRTAVRREVTGEELLASFELEQWNEGNFQFAFGGGAVVEGPQGTYTYDFPTGADALDESALLIRWEDGTKHYEVSFARGNVSDEVEFELTRSSLAVLPIAFKNLASASDSGVKFRTDDPAFEVGS